MGFVFLPYFLVNDSALTDNLAMHMPLNGNYINVINNGAGDNQGNVGFVNANSKRQVANFSGSGGYVKYPSYLLEAGKEMTVCAWIWQPAIQNTYAILIAQGITGSDYDWNIRLNQGKLSMFCQQGYDLSTALQANTWNHICITFNTSKTIKGYVNGVLSGTVNSAQYPTTRGTGLLLGSETTSYRYYYTGRLSDVRIYSVAKSDADIVKIYNYGKTIL